MKPILVIEKDLEETQSVSFCNGEVAYQAKKFRDSPTNGDALGIVPLQKDTGVLLLADGAGGTPGGNKASGAAIRESLGSLESNRSGRIRNAILDGFERSNHLLREQATGACTTLFVVEFLKGSVRPYYVGDSLILISGQKGKIKYQCVPHSPDGYAAEAGVIDQTETLGGDSKYEVLNLVGSNDMRIEVGPEIELAQNDTVVICSDGISDNLTADEISDLLRTGDLHESVATVCAEAIKRMDHPGGKPDDISILAYRSS